MSQLKKHGLYKQFFNKEKTVLYYSGSFFQNILVELGEKLKNKLFTLQIKNKTTKKIFAIFIELCQNIYHYSEEKININGINKPAGSGKIIVYEDKNSYYVMSGNLIKNTQKDFLIERCGFINKLDNVALKMHYKQRLHDANGQHGGVGFIDVVRKSNNPLICEIVPIDNSVLFLIIKVQIDKEK